MNTPTLLGYQETCSRKGFYGKTHERKRLSSSDLIQEALSAALTERERKDYGELAGESVLQLAHDRGGMEVSPHMAHTAVMHTAALADILATALRKPGAEPWAIPPDATVAGHPWKSSSFLSPDGELRRVVLATRWSDEVHYRECHSWRSLGEVCIYQKPQTIAVMIIGENRDGRRHSPWTKGMLHPSGNNQLRFAKRQYKQQGFKDTWINVWREDREEISREKWMQALLDDGILREICFTVRVEVPKDPVRQRVLRIASDKLRMLDHRNQLPAPSLSVCDSPPCPFREPCAADRPVPSSEKYVQISF